MSFGSESVDRPVSPDGPVARTTPRRNVLAEHPLLCVELEGFDAALGAWCRQVARPPHTAEDVEQQVKCTILERAVRVEDALGKRADPGWRRAYLCLCAKSIWLDMLRSTAVWTRAWRQIDETELDDAQARQHASCHEVVEAAQLQERAALLAQAINELHDERWRIIVVRYGLEGLSHVDVAREVELPVATERSYYSRALAELAARLQQFQHDLE